MVCWLRRLEPYDISPRMVSRLERARMTQLRRDQDDTTHHIDNVPFYKEGNQTYIRNILHVPTIVKNMVSVHKIVKQGMQVWFNHEGCFIEKYSEEYGLGPQDCGARHASPVQSQRLLHWKGRPNYRSLSKGRVDVHSRLSRDEICNVCKWS